MKKLCGINEVCFDNSKESYGHCLCLCDFLSERKIDNNNTVGICTKYENIEVEVYTTLSEYEELIM